MYIDPNKRSMRWLLIFDNVENTDSVLETFPPESQGSVIITTRSGDTSFTLGKVSINVPLFTPDESQQFLLAINPENEANRSSELDATHHISTRLGHLPLVLNQIGGYTRSTSLSYASFIRNYGDFDTNLIFQDDRKNPFYENSVRNTWSMTLNTIGQETRQLMEVIAFLDPDEIPIELFECRDVKDK